MKLLNLHIENFGKLSDVDIDLNNGTNVIFHENGWGKSTLAEFIRVMFYGLEGSRKKEYLEVMAVDSPYLTVKTQSTIVGTRLGASTVATYALLKYFGRSGYAELADQLMQNTLFLKESLEKIGYDIIVEPELNIVAFNHPQKSPDELSKELEKINGWKVSVANCPKAIRIVLMNHVTKTHLKEFLNDLEELF